MCVACVCVCAFASPLRIDARAAAPFSLSATRYGMGDEIGLHLVENQFLLCRLSCSLIHSVCISMRQLFSCTAFHSFAAAVF